MAVPHRREGLERRDVAPRVNHQAFHSPTPLCMKYGHTVSSRPECDF